MSETSDQIPTFDLLVTPGSIHSAAEAQRYQMK